MGFKECFLASTAISSDLSHFKSVMHVTKHRSFPISCIANG